MLWRIAVSATLVVLIVVAFGNAYALGWINWQREWGRNVVVIFAALMAVGACFYKEVSTVVDRCDACGKVIEFGDTFTAALHDPVRSVTRPLTRDDTPPYDGILMRFHNSCWERRA